MPKANLVCRVAVFTSQRFLFEPQGLKGTPTPDPRFGQVWGNGWSSQDQFRGGRAGKMLYPSAPDRHRSRTQSAEQFDQSARVIQVSRFLGPHSFSRLSSQPDLLTNADGVQDDVRRRFAEIARAVEGDACSLDWSSATHLLSLPKFLPTKEHGNSAQEATDHPAPSRGGGSVDPAHPRREGLWSAESSFLLSLGSCPDGSGEDALSSVSMESSSSLLLHPCEGRALPASPPRAPAPAHRPPPSSASPNKPPSPSSIRPRSNASRSSPSSPSARGVLCFSATEQGPEGAGGGQLRSAGDSFASATPTKSPAAAEATQRCAPPPHALLTYQIPALPR